MKYIQLFAWGNFDIQYTASIWVGDESLPDPDDSQFYLTNNVEKAEQYLKELGYIELNTIGFQIGGGL